MAHRQDIETPMADEVVRDDAPTAPQMSFGWTFEALPLEEARRLARASRMDEGEYSMLREQLTRLAEDTSASVRITPPPAVSYQKARNHCLKVAKNLAVAITVRRAPGGQIVCWKATAQEIALRENAAQRCNVDEPRRPWSRHRQRPGGQNASALPRNRPWFDATLLIASRGQRSCPCDVFMAPTCRSHGWGVCVVMYYLRLFSLARSIIRKEARRLLRIVPPPIIEFCGRGIGMPSCGLHILKACAIVECCGDERGAHRMRRVSPVESNVPRILAQIRSITSGCRCRRASRPWRLSRTGRKSGPSISSPCPARSR